MQNLFTAIPRKTNITQFIIGDHVRYAIIQFMTLHTNVSFYMQQKKRAPPDYIFKKYSQADGIIFKKHAHNRWRQKERLRSLSIQSDRISTYIGRMDFTIGVVRHTEGKGKGMRSGEDERLVFRV